MPHCLRFQKHLYLILIATSFFSIKGETHWESIVKESHTFKYSSPETAPSTTWTQLSFDDETWLSGMGGFGYGDNDDVTIIEATSSIYLRKKIIIPENLSINRLLLDIDYDDAFVAYINGVEIARSSNLPTGAIGITANLTSDHEARLYNAGQAERHEISPQILTQGDNLLAIQVLNVSSTSSDLSARVFLNAEINSSEIIFDQLPSWFVAPINFISSNLPIIKINTQGETIVDEPKITATMQIINNANGINYFADTVFEYDGYIGIEIRGFTSQNYDKKSYTVETRNEDGSNNNTELMGMPKENDWVLHGPYSDKSLMRNALAYHLGNRMVKWCPRTRFAEVQINGEYRGIYLITEKIKIDKNRLDIAKLKEIDISGDQLTGGYIISIDRDQEGSWNSPYMGRTGSVDVPFSYVDPKYDELTIEQRNYIKDYIIEFETALKESRFKDPENGYRAYIDVESFVDYFIMTELSRDLDGYRVSVFFHKDKDSKGGKLTMGPFWDYNLCFGNANFMQAYNPEGWAADGIGSADSYEIPFWWDRFREDPYFETILQYRWEELRQTVISKAAVEHFI
ncbi:MAG: CotH kinase family protein, partial [Bacteroidales bacterium]|nr:CotH kinase family protein [Bacteroidales bacterium]